MMLYGNISPSENGYLATLESDNYYECIEEVYLSEYLIIWYDDFEIDRGWVGYGGLGEWERAPPPTSPSAEYGYPDPTSAISGRHIIGNDLTGKGTKLYCYENSIPATAWLVSPKINCSGYYGIVLVFWAYLGVENNPYDYAYIEVKSSKTGWIRIYRNGPTSTDNDWHLMVFNISHIADNDPEVYVRFGIGPTDSSYVFCGWNIDDVRLLASARVKEYNYTIIVTFSTQGYYESPTIRLGGNVIAVYYNYSCCIPEGTSLSFYVSRDGGVTWTDITSYENVEYWFGSENAGEDFRFNITMRGTGYSTPVIWNIYIVVKYVVYGTIIFGNRSGDAFGYHVCGGGNIANDTYLPDIIIGAPGVDRDENNRVDCGGIYVFTGRHN